MSDFWYVFVLKLSSNFCLKVYIPERIILFEAIFARYTSSPLNFSINSRGYFSLYLRNFFKQGFLSVFDMYELNFLASYRYFILRRRARKLGKYFGRTSLVFDKFTLSNYFQERFFRSFKVAFLKKYNVVSNK